MIEYTITVRIQGALVRYERVKGYGAAYRTFRKWEELAVGKVDALVGWFDDRGNTIRTFSPQL